MHVHVKSQRLQTQSRLSSRSFALSVVRRAISWGQETRERIFLKAPGVIVSMLQPSKKEKKCTRNWPLPIGAFQDNDKLIFKHNYVFT